MSADLVTPAATISISHELAELLATAEEPARRMLSAWETETLVQVRPGKYQLHCQTADRWPHALPDHAPDDVRLAAQLLIVANDLRRALHAQDDAQAMEQALRLAVLTQRMKTIRHETNQRKAG